MVDISENHKKRVKDELIKAGVSRYGLIKMQSRHLHEIIHPEEHIEAVAYGVRNNYSSMLVATDRRLIYVERKPFYSVTDELTYEMIAGVGYNVRGNRTGITLHTRVGDYVLRYVNTKAASKFVKYIEKRRVENLNGKPTNEIPLRSAEIAQTVNLKQELSKEAITFLHRKHTATLSTIDRTGNLHGAVIYYFVDANNTIYILSKSETHKVHNILYHEQIALTIYDANTKETLQIQGTAQVEPDQGVRDFVFHELTQPRKYIDKVDLPPVTKLSHGSFIVLRINISTAIFNNFSKVVN